MKDVKVIKQGNDAVGLEFKSKTNNSKLMFVDNDLEFKGHKIDQELTDLLDIRYRDEFPGGAWVPAAASAAPDLVNYTIEGVGARLYSFNGVNTEERLSSTFEIPHDIALDELNSEDLSIEVHVHCMGATIGAGDVKWFLDYCYIPAFGAPIAQTSLSTLISIEANQQFVHKLGGFKTAEGVASIPKPVGGFNIGDIILFDIRRNPADEEDTYAADVILLQVAMHVPVDDKGSKTRYTK